MKKHQRTTRRTHYSKAKQELTNHTPLYIEDFTSEKKTNGKGEKS